MVRDGLPEVPRTQREAQPKQPAFHPVTEALGSSQQGLHQRHHVVNATCYIHHLTWNRHLTEFHTEEHKVRRNSPQPAPIIGCMVSAVCLCVCFVFCLHQCFLTRHGKNWSSLVPMPKQPLTFFPQTKSSPRSAKQASKSHFRSDRSFLLTEGLIKIFSAVCSSWSDEL